MYLLVTTVSFNQSTYIAYEKNGYLRPELVLSKASSVDVTVKVTTKEITARESHNIIKFHFMNSAIYIHTKFNFHTAFDICTYVRTSAEYFKYNYYYFGKV